MLQLRRKKKIKCKVWLALKFFIHFFISKEKKKGGKKAKERRTFKYNKIQNYVGIRRDGGCRKNSGCSLLDIVLKLPETGKHNVKFRF